MPHSLQERIKDLILKLSIWLFRASQWSWLKHISSIQQIQVIWETRTFYFTLPRLLIPDLIILKFFSPYLEWADKRDRKCLIWNYQAHFGITLGSLLPTFLLSCEGLPSLFNHLLCMKPWRGWANNIYVPTLNVKSVLFQPDLLGKSFCPSYIIKVEYANCSLHWSSAGSSTSGLVTMMQTNHQGKMFQLIG